MKNNKFHRAWFGLLIAILPAATLLSISSGALAQATGRGGKEVVEAVCAQCHAKGEKGAPKIGDKQIGRASCRERV